MPDNALPAIVVDQADEVDAVDEADQVDLAALIPTQRVAEPEFEVGTPAGPTTSPERLAFLWTAIGAVAGSVVVALAFLVLLTLLP